MAGKSKIAAQIMAQSKTTIDDVPLDIMQEIMMQVAETPNGVVEIFNSYFICKAFHRLSKDEKILKTVVFADLPTYCFHLCDPSSLFRWEGSTPDLSSEFEAFQKIGGYIYRAAAAGNPSAELILAKLIIKSTAEALRGLSSPSSSEIRQGRVTERSSRIAKARSFIAHFMPTREANDNSSGKKLVHYELVKKFLVRANHEELEKMGPYLEDYVTYFCERRAEDSCNRFLALLNELHQLNTSVVVRISAQSYARSFNGMCASGRKNMQALGVQVSLQVHKLPKVREIHFLEPTEVIDRFIAVEAILKGAMKQIIGPNRDIDDPENQLSPRPLSNTIQRIRVVKDSLLTYLRYIEGIRKRQADIISQFNGIFNIKDV